MPDKNRCIVVLAGLLLASVALADGHGACSKCHADDEFAGMGAAEIEANVRDSSIPPHRQLSELTDEQVQAIAAELADAG